MIKSKASLALALSAAIATSMVLVSGCTTQTRHESSGPQYISSSAITFKVKENLLRDPGVKSAHISVSTYKDTVTLSGYVDTEDQEDRAIEVARNVKGVKYVVDNLRVKNT